jgi:hypothetical protein
VQRLCDDNYNNNSVIYTNTHIISIEFEEKRKWELSLIFVFVVHNYIK